MEIIFKMLADLEQQLQEIELSSDSILALAQRAYKTVEVALISLKAFITAYTFNSTDEEIYFFKEIKPQFYSKLIYYVHVFSIETHRPAGSVKVLKKYLKSHLSTITRFSYDNREFYKYYRSGAKYLDDKYFIRDKFDIAVGFDTVYFDCDPSFCTSHDYKMSMLLANEMLASYLNAELKANDMPQDVNALEDVALGWADSNVSLVEMLYSLATSKVFYHKKTNSVANVKQVFTYFQTLLGVDLGNYYRTLQEIRIRKNRTAFLDRTRNDFIKRMDDSDESFH